MTKVLHFTFESAIKFEQVMEEIIATIGQKMSEIFLDFKWVKSRSHLIRKTAAGWQALTIDVLPTSQPGVFKLTTYAQIRLEDVAKIYLPLHPFVDERDKKAFPTLTVNCDNLIKNRDLIHGFKIDSSALDGLLNLYSKAIKDDVFPWLEEFSDENRVRENLKGADPMEWLTSDRLVRFTVLLALLAKKFDWDGFDRISNDFHEWCTQPHALVYKPVANAMDRLKQNKNI